MIQPVKKTVAPGTGGKTACAASPTENTTQTKVNSCISEPTAYISQDMSQAAVFSWKSDEKTEPTLWELMQEAKKKADERREKMKLPSHIRYGDAAVEAYVRLSRARNTAMVNSTKAYARRQIQRLQNAKRYDSDNAKRIQAEISQLKRAIRRAGKKQWDLERENLDEAHQKRLLREEELQKAKRLQDALSRRRTMRAFRENAYIQEAQIDKKHQDQIAQTEWELRQQLQKYSTPTATVSPDTAITRYTEQNVSVSVPEVSAQA